jgi:hypothetical protein
MPVAGTVRSAPQNAHPMMNSATSSGSVISHKSVEAFLISKSVEPNEELKVG